ncbi:hypothetical protein I8752_36550 [Nostocaceae cyanobacterium CENA369]|uniref:Uncharacterized protein n=1 Tax=Dendronalium phyllosphericum CENA369 TaxID=1725256 RepID=A0A8J7IWE9_9NOST|nr:hypothetical protein [Dendronalium phyllosphericum]MBH8578357.1 hypothetical protein [Dendronalium phyllosphericum CENA369]
MSEQKPEQLPDASGFFDDHLPKPPEWINFQHPDFPKYFYIAIIDKNGQIKTWWQRLPEHLRPSPPLQGDRS